MRLYVLYSCVAHSSFDACVSCRKRFCSRSALFLGLAFIWREDRWACRRCCISRTPDHSVLQAKTNASGALSVFRHDASWLVPGGHPLHSGLHGRTSYRRNLDAHYRWPDREQGWPHLGTIFPALWNWRGVSHGYLLPAAQAPCQ